MNLRLVVALFLILFFCSHQGSAQDTLPRFSLKNFGNNRVVIGWVNPFQSLKQISIQRSFDSLKNYRTILSVADPSAVQNGFADTKAPNDHMFYRILYVLEGGHFFFTAAKKPLFDSGSKTSMQPNIPVDGGPKDVKKEPVIKKPDFVPSFYVYTNREGYVFINLPDADEKKYNLKFYDGSNTFLFEIKNLKEKAVTLDKANFYASGWYNFELYNDEKLVERHKFYLGKNF
ncbi:MAG TPA: hypothetical protein VM888_13460 [Chitinophagaceae bacterium]|jgi:hypothetical protein|nr:hypothetical protein [Chitinophagaceae bacterium]